MEHRLGGIVHKPCHQPVYFTFIRKHNQKDNYYEENI